MNITILVDRSYQSMSLKNSNKVYRFLQQLVEHLPVLADGSVAMRHKYRFGSYGTSTCFLCSMATVPHMSFLYAPFSYIFKPHFDTPHQVWTDAVKADMKEMTTSSPFPPQGENNIRNVLHEVTHGHPMVAADHVVVIACWPLEESHYTLKVMRETASVTLVNLEKWCSPKKVAHYITSMREKVPLCKRTMSFTRLEQLHISMLRFLKERAPVVLQEEYGQLPPCAAPKSDCSAKICD